MLTKKTVRMGHLGGLEKNRLSADRSTWPHKKSGRD